MNRLESIFSNLDRTANIAVVLIISSLLVLLLSELLNQRLLSGRCARMINGRVCSKG